MIVRIKGTQCSQMQSMKENQQFPSNAQEVSPEGDLITWHLKTLVLI
ncbi:unnamed protein product [Paramecium primaurelia]|uniref:Uncharacterized protein n=1 Tax=Paramecium primaurelia TaxID=5886 RepID=A0A8S1QGD8_PARPR|nr:unnamed protein product [Paramecium primaurelia]